MIVYLFISCCCIGNIQRQLYRKTLIENSFRVKNNDDFLALPDGGNKKSKKKGKGSSSSKKEKSKSKSKKSDKRRASLSDVEEDPEESGDEEGGSYEQNQSSDRLYHKSYDG